MFVDYHSYSSSKMAVLYVGDSIFKYLRITRSGSCVRYSSGARVEQLPEGLHNLVAFQLSGKMLFSGYMVFH